MPESVQVAGVEVTQPTLEKMFARLRERHHFGIPADYTPSLDRFHEAGTATATHEAVVYEYIRDGNMPPWFVSEFLQATPDPTPFKTPAAVLKDAGFPRSAYALAKPWDSPAPSTVEAWARTLGGTVEPWLWVKSLDDGRRLYVLAQAAIAADAAMGGRASILYAAARDLCAEVNTAGRFGERDRESKSEVLAKYKRVPLLMLDRLGTEGGTAHELEALHDLLDARERQLLPTVLAGSTGLSAWVNRYARIDGIQAHDLSRVVCSGLGGYANPDEARDAEAIRSRVLDLDQPHPLG